MKINTVGLMSDTMHSLTKTNEIKLSENGNDKLMYSFHKKKKKEKKTAFYHYSTTEYTHCIPQFF